MSVFFLGALISGQAVGEGLASEVVKNLQVEEQVRIQLNICREETDFVTPEELLKVDSNYFHGFNEQSEEWPNVVDIYTEYFEEQCNYYTPQDSIEILINTYKETLTPSELAEVLAFYSTSSGKKLIEASNIANIRLQKKVSKNAAKVQREAAEVYTKKLTDLASKYQR
jgi:hypothetical protein